ncbi:MAG: extracellular solute-binding protein, partial [Lachnospiraceae bacterium]
MKKKLVTMTLVAAMTAAALAGCGSSSSSSSSADSAATTAATEATAASTEAASATTEAPAATGDQVSLNVIAAQYGQNTASWWADFQKEFNEANPGINLNVEVVSWNDIYTVVNTRIANGQAPDILNIDVFADFVADDLLVPASEYTSDEVYNKLYPSFLEQSDIDGTIWAIPDLA